MNQQTSPSVQALAPYCQGRGVQYFPSTEAPFHGVSIQDGPEFDAADSSLDFVVAGPEWIRGGIPTRLLQGWRRLIGEGGRIALLVEGDAVHVDVLARYVGVEGGFAMDNPVAVDDGVWMLTGQRDFKHCLLQVTETLGREIGREDKPDGWESELSFALGSLLLNAGDGPNASIFFNSALAEEPQSIEAMIGLGLALGLQANWRGAESVLKEVLAMEPGHPIATEWLERFRNNLLRPQPAKANVASVSAPIPNPVPGA